MSTEAPAAHNRVASVEPVRMELGAQQKSEHAIIKRSLSPRFYWGGGRLGNQPKQSYVDEASTEQYSYTTEGHVFINHGLPSRSMRGAQADLQNSLEVSNTPFSQAGLEKLLPLSRASQRNSVIAVTSDGRVSVIKLRMSDVETANAPSETEVHVERTAWRISQAFEKSFADAFKGYVDDFESGTPVLSSQTGKVEWLTPTEWTQGNFTKLTMGIPTEAAVPTHLTNKPEVSVLAGRWPHHEVYEARIMELRGFAEDDEDIEAVNENSISDFWSFMEDNPYLRRAGLALLDNGDLRAVWRENDGNNVGLEFLGDESILYVMFRRYPDGRETERDAGITTFDGVVGKLQDLDLLSFVNGWDD